MLSEILKCSTVALRKRRRRDAFFATPPNFKLCSPLCLTIFIIDVVVVIVVVVDNEDDVGEADDVVDDVDDNRDGEDVEEFRTTAG